MEIYSLDKRTNTRRDRSYLYTTLETKHESSSLYLTKKHLVSTNPTRIEETHFTINLVEALGSKKIFQDELVAVGRYYWGEEIHLRTYLTAARTSQVEEM